MAFNITSSPTSAEILASLLGDTTGLSNIQITVSGNPLAVGILQDLSLNLRSGLLLSTGQVNRLQGSNTNDRNNVSTVFNSPGTVENGNDAITLEITFDTDDVSRQLFLQYVFGSEEFLDFAGNSFNDRLSLELNGIDLAKLNNGNPVNVNSLTPSNNPATFSPDFITNLSSVNPVYSQAVVDGYTVPLTLNGNLLPNVKNRLVITIQDIGDGAVDSAVFLSGGSLGVSNPVPTVEIIVGSPGSVDEDGAGGIFYTFTRTGVPDKALSVNYQLGGTATFDTDYSSPDFPSQSGTVNFAAGSASTTVFISTRIDALVEADETIIVNLLPANNAEYLVGANRSVTRTILDEDTPLNNISLTVSPNEVIEDGSGNLIYTFTRTGSTTESLRVDFNLDGTALFADDYNVLTASVFQGSAGSVTFDVGASTTSLVIEARPDFIIEAPETVAITLTSSRNDPRLGGRSRSYIIDTPNAVVGNIIDSPPALPAISLEVRPNIVGENNQANLSYLFTRTGSTTSPLTIQYSVRGTASLGADYTVTGATSFDDTIGTVTFQAGSALAIVNIAPTPDSVTELNETVILQLDTIAGAIGGYNIDTFSEVVGTVVDAATPIINVVLEPQSTGEGSPVHLFYGFSRSGSTNEALTVNYNVSGTATFDADYSQIGASSFNNTSGSITFAAGSSTASLGIAPATDGVLDPDETIVLALADSPSYAIGNNNSATGTILDVQPIIPATVSLALNRTSVDEDGASNLSYTFTRNGSTEQPLTVRYQVTGTAIEDTDYSTLGTSTGEGLRVFDFAPGASTFTVRVDPTPDTLVEGTETVSLALLPPGLGYGNTQYIVGNAPPVTGLIIDASPSLPVINVTLSPASVTEDGQTNLIYLFNRTGLTDQPLTINYSISGTAAFTTDYSQIGANNFTGVAGSITFAANSATATLAVTPAADVIAEPDEIVTLTLVGNSTYTIGSNNVASGTIVDVPIVVVTPPTVSLAVSPVNVNEDGTENLAYTFTRDGSTLDSLTVNYRVGGTANDSNDYTLSSALVAATATVTFSVGSNIATVFVNPRPDSLVETDETVEITLVPAGSGQYTVGTSAAVIGTILDQDRALNNISLAVAPSQVTENGTENLIYTFTRTGSTTESLRVDYDFGGAAAFGTDYIVTGANSLGSISSASGTVSLNVGTVNFATGSDTATVVIDPTSDSIAEIDENVTLRLVASRSDTVTGGYNITTPEAIEGIITDAITNITPTINVTLTPTSVSEGSLQNLTYLFTRTGSTTQPLTVNYNFGGSATFAADYNQTGGSTNGATGSITFAANSAEASLVVNSIADSVLEQNETVDLTLLSGSGYGNSNYIIGTPNTLTGTIIEPIVTVTNLPPTAIIFNGNIPNNRFLIAENTNTTNPIRLVDIVITDDQLGTNTLSLSGEDANSFELIGTALFLRSGIALDFETKTTYDLIVAVDDVTVGNTPDVASNFTLVVTDINELPPNGLNFIGTNNLDVGTVNNSTNGVFAVNPNNINFVGDEINLLGGADSVTVPNRIVTLQTNSPNQAIQIGSVDSNSTSILDLTPTDLAALSNGFSRIVFGRASGTGNININSSITFRDPVLFQSPGGQLNITAPISLIDDATLDFNVQALVKSGNSTLTIDGNTATTFIGNTTIDGGALVLAKSPSIEALRNAPVLVNSGVLRLGNNEQINNGADLTLNGGTFNLNGFNETLDQLQISNNSTISLGNRSSKLAFGNSSIQQWTGLLSIENWSSTSDETIRFGNSAIGLTTAQLDNIQFVGFNRGASINASGFIAPIGITVANPTPDQDGVSQDIEDLAPNSGDGNLDGISDGLQENVASILNLGSIDTSGIATIIARAGAKISGLRSLANPITIANLTSLANPIEFKVTGLANGAATTVEYIIAKADQNRRYNTYLVFGATADNATPHAYEFLYDGRTGAELFDTTGDGFVDKAIIHFIDGQRGDSDLTVNGEIQDPGAPGISSTLVGLSLDTNNVVQLAGTAGTAIASFSLVANQTKQVSEVGFFKIDATNTVRGIAANAAGFARTALENGQVIFSSLADNLLSTADIARQLQLNAGDRLGFYLVQNGTVDNALQKNDFSNVVFSLDQANPASRKALEVTTEANGSYRLKWEQGSATIADDLILNLQLQSAPLNNQNLVASIQGDRESELLDLSSFTGQDVQVNFTIKREAAFNNTVGFYKIEDAQGTVTSITGAKIRPGEAGYQAAVVQNRIAGVDLAVANGQTASINAILQGGAIYAPFLIANANASNLNGNFGNVYTLYALGNSDATDHVRLLGDNTFGFEDLVGGGDKDFNDVVVKAVFKNS
jgi:autotransporter-associated beta strand protein